MQFCPVLDFSRFYKKVLFEEEKGSDKTSWGLSVLKGYFIEKTENNCLYKQIVIGKGQWF